MLRTSFTENRVLLVACDTRGWWRWRKGTWWGWMDTGYHASYFPTQSISTLQSVGVLNTTHMCPYLGGPKKPSSQTILVLAPCHPPPSCGWGGSLPSRSGQGFWPKAVPKNGGAMSAKQHEDFQGMLRKSPWPSIKILPLQPRDNKKYDAPSGRLSELFGAKRRHRRKRFLRIKTLSNTHIFCCPCFLFLKKGRNLILFF